MGAFADSEDPDKMPNKKALHPVFREEIHHIT